MQRNGSCAHVQQEGLLARVVGEEGRTRKTQVKSSLILVTSANNGEFIRCRKGCRRRDDNRCRGSDSLSEENRRFVIRGASWGRSPRSAKGDCASSRRTS